ncbi:MAG TPA: PilT/PilU family type 4a pilus ATPase [Opitutaceae bacterium]
MAIHADIRGWIDRMVDDQASDLILTAGQPPVIRVAGELQALEGETLDSEKVWKYACTILNADQQKRFERDREMDSAFGIEDVARFRVNVFQQQGSVGVVMRMLPFQVPTLEKLGVPEIVKKWLLMPHGIVVTTGPTGSGKSTSQAAMIDFLNERKRYHVITIEDPVEYTHRHGLCTIEQREVGTDTSSFSEALRRVFRQAPDVIMIGEMRDRETFEAALQLAETGHLVLATLHTGDATQAISRIVDVFPPDQHQQIRVQLSLTLLGIIVQELVPTIQGDDRVLATEVLEATPAIANLIRKNEIQQIYSVIQTSTQDGMQTMNSNLLKLFQEGKVSLEQARLFTTRQKEFDQLVARQTGVLASV